MNTLGWMLAPGVSKWVALSVSVRCGLFVLLLRGSRQVQRKSSAQKPNFPKQSPGFREFQCWAGDSEGEFWAAARYAGSVTLAAVHGRELQPAANVPESSLFRNFTEVVSHSWIHRCAAGCASMQSRECLTRHQVRSGAEMGCKNKL